MKNRNFDLLENSIEFLTSEECSNINGGSAIYQIFSWAGEVVGAAVGTLVASVKYGINHPAGINAGMENVH